MLTSRTIPVLPLVISFLAYLLASPNFAVAPATAVTSTGQPSYPLKKLVNCRTRVAQLCGPTALTFYMHNTVYHPVVDNKDSFSSVFGQPPNVSWPNPLLFGTTSTFEDPITMGADAASQRIGTGQGFWQFDSKQDFTLFHVFTANITEDEYRGTLEGQVREMDPVRYMSVIGGTGDFLGARGLASCRLLRIDRTPPAMWTLSFELDLYY